MQAVELDFRIATVGERRFPSPLSGVRFVGAFLRAAIADHFRRIGADARLRVL